MIILSPVLNLMRRFFIPLIIAVFLGGIFIGFKYQSDIAVLLPISHPKPPSPHSDLTTVPAPFSLDNTPHLYLPRSSQSLPLIFSNTFDDQYIQTQLQHGAVVLPFGPNFGEQGNIVITAHSTGPAAFGPYRFAFSELANLQTGDHVLIKTIAADYTYQVFSQQIIWPHELDQLPRDDRPTLTLVTCWPLWTDFKRLLVNAILTKIEYH